MRGQGTVIPFEGFNRKEFVVAKRFKLVAEITGDHNPADEEFT